MAEQNPPTPIGPGPTQVYRPSYSAFVVPWMLVLGAAWSIWWLLGALSPAIEPAPDFFDLTRIPLLLVFLGGGLWWLLFPLGLTAQTLQARASTGAGAPFPGKRSGP